MNNIIHFFDLDNTLWSIHNSVWVIHKNRPNTPILKLTKDDYLNIVNGIYHDDELEVLYNGNKFWISQKLFDIIKKKRPAIELEDIGISFTERTNPKYFTKIKIYIDNIRHLIDKKADIGILSARYSQETDKLLLSTLNNELAKYDLQINKFYYTSDYFQYKHNVHMSNDKALIILEHLVGFHIKNNKFVPIKQDSYNEIHFYDDEFSNIDYANNIQQYLTDYLENTDDLVFDKIIDRITKNEIKLYTHLITNNSLNMFKTTEIILKTPIKYPIQIQEGKIVKFNEFK
jgi:hypothetical protein